MKDWWCPTCKMMIGGKQVTHQGYHELCGTYLEDCQEISDEDKLQSCIDYLLEYNLTPNKYREIYNKFNSINP
jgi:hypothetical protein